MPVAITSSANVRVTKHIVPSGHTSTGSAQVRWRCAPLQAGNNGNGPSRSVSGVVRGIVERLELAAGLQPRHQNHHRSEEHNHHHSSGAASTPPSALAAGAVARPQQQQQRQAPSHAALSAQPAPHPSLGLPHDPAEAARERLHEATHQHHQEDAAGAHPHAHLLAGGFFAEGLQSLESSMPALTDSLPALEPLPSLESLYEGVRSAYSALRHSMEDPSEAAAEVAGRIIGKHNYEHPSRAQQAQQQHSGGVWSNILPAPPAVGRSSGAAGSRDGLPLPQLGGSPRPRAAWPAHHSSQGTGSSRAQPPAAPGPQRQQQEQQQQQ